VPEVYIFLIPSAQSLAICEAPVKSDDAKALAQAIADNRWSSLQDVILLLGGMIVAGVLALEYDLFRFGDELTVEERRLTLAELIFLSALLAVGIFAFILRRLYEGRTAAIHRLHRNLEIEKLKDQTLRDPLTGLLNRRGMQAALTAATSGAGDHGRQDALFLLDLDNFKRVNEIHGHSVADHVVKIIVERLSAVARPTDVLARLGDDEFAVLAHDVDRDAAQATGQRFIAALQSEIFVEGYANTFSVAIGAVMVPQQGTTAGEVLHNADLAMYRAREQDQPALVFFGGPDDAPINTAQTDGNTTER
jgi:diguanylate cyclase (GGDEF)-like protein